MSKKIIASILCAFAFQLSFSQEKLMPGYIVQLNGDTVKGFIDYRNWEKSPKKVSFVEGNHDKISLAPNEIKAFGVSGESYKSAIVQTEVSVSNAPLTEQYSNEFTFQNETGFIQTLVEGDKSLYFYKSSLGKENFYIKKKGDEYELLLYKQYVQLINSSNQIMENKKFLGQLALYLQGCPNIQKELSKTKYSVKSLSKLFTYYYANTSAKSQFIKKKDKAKFEYGLLAGASVTSVKFQSGNDFFDYLTTVDFPKSTDFAGGVSLEIVSPKKNGRLSIYNELIYTSFNTSAHYENYIDANRYTYIDTKIGMSYLKMNNMLRINFPFKKITFYSNMGLTTGIVIKETNYKRYEFNSFTNNTITEGEAIENSRNFDVGYLFGIGAKVKKISLEARFEDNINNLSLSTTLHSGVTRFYFVLGYRF